MQSWNQTLRNKLHYMILIHDTKNTLNVLEENRACCAAMLRYVHSSKGKNCLPVFVCGVNDSVNKWMLNQGTFQRCFNVVFWLMQRGDVGQSQINVETTLCISTLKFTTSNNVQSTLCISTLTWTTLDNVEATLSFSTSSFTKLVNVETTLWKWENDRF